MQRRDWEPEEDAIVADGLARRRSLAEIADELAAAGYPDRTRGSIQKRSHRPGFTRRQAVTLTRVVSETPEATVYAPEESEDEPIEELLDRTIRLTQRAVQKARARRFAVARLITRKPVGIAFASDQHLSTDAPIDVAKAFADARAIQQEPGLFCVLGGDGVDNHIKHRAALVGKRSAPADEWRLYDHYIQTLGLKVLAMISGNHDDWTRDFAGVDMVANLAARRKVHYSPDEVVLTVELAPDPHGPAVEYVAKMRHQYRFNSALNVGHTVKRMYDMGGDVFDVGVVCHNHEAHVESFERHGATRWALRPGSYQIQTSHGRRYGYNESTPTCPVAIFWPDERRVVCFQDLREGIMHLRAARAEYDREAA